MTQGAQLRAQDLVKEMAVHAPLTFTKLGGARTVSTCKIGCKRKEEIMLGASEDKLEVSWIEWLEDSPIDDREVSRRRAHCL